MDVYNLCSTMSERSIALADKLLFEGERTAQFFENLSAMQWLHQMYDHGAKWTVRGVFEHLIVSERQLQQLFEMIVRTKVGTPESMDVNLLNLERTGTLGLFSCAEMARDYRSTRQQTIEFTRELTDAQLAIRARHPAIGESALEDQIKLLYIHHQMHVREVKKALAL